MTSFDIVEGVIFRIQDKNPTDKLIYLVSEEGEKVALLAKNVKKQTSKRAQSIEIGNLVRAKYIGGYNISILTDIKILNEFLHWKRDFKNMIYLQLICEIVNQYVHEEIKEEKIFTVLVDILSQQSARLEYLTSIFIIKVLNITGHLPELDKDIFTYEDIDSQNAYLSLGQIGYIRDGAKAYKKVPDRIYKTQRFVLNSNIQNALKINLTEEEEKELLKLHMDWFEISIDKKLKSREILREMFSV